MSNICFQGSGNWSLLEWRQNLRRKRYVFPNGGWRNKSPISPGIYSSLTFQIKKDQKTIPKRPNVEVSSVIQWHPNVYRLCVCIWSCVSKPTSLTDRCNLKHLQAALKRMHIMLKVGRGTLDVGCSSEGNLYNTQFAVPLRISVLLLGDGRMCCFWIFFLISRKSVKRKIGTKTAATRWSCEWLFQPCDPFATRRILAVSTSWPMRRMRRRIRQLALVDTDIDWFFDGSEDGLRGTLHISVRLYISLMNNMIPYSKGTLMEHPQSSNLCWDQFISAPSDLQMRKN